MNIFFATSATSNKSPFESKEKRPPLGLEFLIFLVRDARHILGRTMASSLRKARFALGYPKKSSAEYVTVIMNQSTKFSTKIQHSLCRRIFESEKCHSIASRVSQ